MVNYQYRSFFLVTRTLIRGAKTWQEDTGALRGKPLKNNLCGVAAAGIAVRGCVGRPLSLEIGDCPSCRLVRLLVWIRRGVTKLICVKRCLMADFDRWDLFSESYRIVISGSEYGNLKQLILQYIIPVHYTSSPFMALIVGLSWARGESRAVFLNKLTCISQPGPEVNP